MYKKIKLNVYNINVLMGRLFQDVRFFMIILLLIGGIYSCYSQQKHTFGIHEGEFVYDGKPIKIYAGEMHYTRVPKEYWRHRLKMLKALGLNTVATYMFWNYHEPLPGVWDFKTGNRNISEFIKIAAEEGLMVILRPGPYSCAEWDFGGYPWWLQNDKEVVIRNKNSKFLTYVKDYINHIAYEVKDMLVSRGGPVIMVQAENEFGSYVLQRKDVPLLEHKEYSLAFKEILLEAGFDVPIFTCDGSIMFEGGTINGALPTATGLTDMPKLIELVNQYNSGKGPYMLTEWYPGGLAPFHWGEKLPKLPIEDLKNQLDSILKYGLSFNFYMAHGGTSFGFTNGANYRDELNMFQPSVTSYDLDWLISEAGWATPKYLAIREKLAANVTYHIPAIPKPLPVIEIPSINLSQTVDLFAIKNKFVHVTNDTPLTFESLNQGYGYVMYTKKFEKAVTGQLEINGLRDYAIIYVNGKKVAELNRFYKNFSCDIVIPSGATLDIFVENMGRINYGAELIHNLKGIISPVIINGKEITGGWKMFKMPLEIPPTLKDISNKYTKDHPVFYRGTFTLNKTGDTFLDMTEWGKGIVYVNGHHLGRYWNIGPQQTLYLPGCWLKEGINEIVIFEQKNYVKQTTVKAIKTPILDQMR
jgi:beta-galactosidase